MTKSHHPRIVVAGVTVAAIIALSGCSATSSAGGSTSTAAGSTAAGSTAAGSTAAGSTAAGSTAAASSALSAATVKTFTGYTGAKAGAADPKLSPIHIGNVNQETGPGALPELTRFFDAGINLINTQLGGVGGHPITVTTCDVTSPETGISCAQKFANDKTIVAVVENSISQGADSFHSVLDKTDVPIVSALPYSPVDGRAPNSYYTSAGSFATVGAINSLLRDSFKGKSIAVVIPSGDPVSVQLGAALSGMLGAAGIKVTQASFSTSETDPTAALLAAGVGKADVIVPAVVTPPACLAVAKALNALGTKSPVIGQASCTSAAVSKALGDLPKWTYLYAFTNPDAPSTDATTTAQIAAYEEWWKPLKEDIVGVIGLQVALTLQHHLIAGGADKATAKTISAAAKAWKGPIFLGPPTVAYGGAPFPALPTLSALRAYTYGGSGKWTNELDGKWLGAQQ